MTKLSALGGALTLALAAGAGCETKSWFDPSEVGRFKQDRLVVKILDQLDPGRESAEAQFASAEDVRASDLEVNATDYVIGPNDVLNVSITDLQGPGIETVRTIRVTESGFLNLPLIGQVKADGLTEAQLQEAIGQAYSQAGIFAQGQTPAVTVAVAEARARTFRILGSVGRPSTYVIIEADYRLLDALVDAGDINTTGIDHLFVIRERRAEQPRGTGGAGGAAPAPAPPRPATGRDPLAPRGQLTQPATPGAGETADAGTHTRIALLQARTDAPAANTAGGASRPAGETEGRYQIIDGRPILVGPDSPPPANAPVARAQAGGAAPRGQNPPPPAARRTTGGGGGFEFNAPREPENVRVIRVPIEPLKNGELKYNIVIRPGDLIVVPSPVIGVYYMGGHVNAPGPYSLTGQRITLKNAVVGARGLDALAIPARTDVIRRIGTHEEMFVRVDLEKIFAGQQSDLYLKPDDQVMVGTNAVAPFLAAFRNAFRLTYGFGFLYDRNFADDDSDGISD